MIKDQGKIFSLYTQGVSLNTIAGAHLGYGTYLSMKYYVKKTFPTLPLFLTKRKDKGIIPLSA
jgi:hypothetical protein